MNIDNIFPKTGYILVRPYDADRFTFEAGRHCCTGEGIFVFKTVQGETIHNKLKEETEKMAASKRATENVQNNTLSILPENSAS